MLLIFWTTVLALALQIGKQRMRKGIVEKRREQIIQRQTRLAERATKSDIFESTNSL